MIQNRSQAPAISQITQIHLPAIEKSKLDNGIPVYTVNTGTQDVVKIQLVFKAGIWYQSQPLQAYFTNQMLEEGTQSKSAAELSEKLDFYGSYINLKVNRDNACVDVYCLNKYLEPILDIVSDMVMHPLFGEKELNRLRDQEKQAHLIRNEKVRFIAQKQFSTLLYGNKHPYGTTATLEDYDKISVKTINAFHHGYYGSGNCHIFISGKTSKRTFSTLNRFFGESPWGQTEGVIETDFLPSTSIETKHFMPKEQVMQSAIRMGKRIIGRKHPDYFSLSVVSTLFGGYFGSRLMSNIREDKGYTYGIYAGMHPQIHDNAFIISSEVGADVAQKAVDEIRYELKRLRTQKVSNEELTLVKNYMSGTFLRTLNGVFALGDVVKSLYEQNLPEDFYQQYLKRIHQVSPAEVQQIAETYLHEDQMLELIVGKK